MDCNRYNYAFILSLGTGVLLEKTSKLERRVTHFTFVHTKAKLFLGKKYADFFSLLLQILENITTNKKNPVFFSNERIYQNNVS